MKSVMCFIAGAAVGALVVWLGLQRDGGTERRPAGHYTIINVGAPDAPRAMRLNTATGQSWIYNGGWIESKELAVVATNGLRDDSGSK